MQEKRSRKLRPLSGTHRLNSRSERPVTNAVEDSVLAFAREGLRFRGREFSKEAFINAACWFFAELDREEQSRILDAYLPRLEALLLSPDPGAALGRKADAFGSRRSVDGDGPGRRKKPG